MWFEQKHLGAFVLYLLVAVAMVSVSGTNDTWAATDQMEIALYAFAHFNPQHLRLDTI